MGVHSKGQHVFTLSLRVYPSKLKQCAKTGPASILHNSPQFYPQNVMGRSVLPFTLKDTSLKGKERGKIASQLEMKALFSLLAEETYDL